MLLAAQPVLDQLPRPTHTDKKLGILLVGTNPDSELYIRLKQQRAQAYGVETVLTRLPQSATSSTIVAAIETLNRDPSIDGVIVQLPFPDPLLTDQLLDRIDPKKDVDNLTGANYFISPMVQSVAALLNFYAIDLRDKKVCVVGQGRLVGQPIIAWLKGLGCNPMVINSAEHFDTEVILNADVVIAGTGSQHIINARTTRSGQVVLDCSGKDVDFDAVKDRVAAVTPPKGGIGPLTVHFLLMNLLKT